MEGEKVLKQVQYITDVIKWTIICFYLQLSGVKAYYKIFNTHHVQALLINEYRRKLSYQSEYCYMDTNTSECNMKVFTVISTG